MKKFFPIILVFLSFFVKASENTLQVLSTVNAQWQKQNDISHVINETSIAPNINHIDLIALHLQLVEKTLSMRSVEHLNVQQQDNRKKLLHLLKTYGEAKKFPVNDYLTYQSPVFIDRNGTHCAVGYLMQQSGYESLAKEIDAKQKFAYVHDIKVIGVYEWAQEQGFTIDELAWIQPGYWVTTAAYSLDGGVNGQVNAIVVEQGGMSIYVAGSFNTAGGTVAANNIAVYQSGFAGWFWMALGNGVNGTIKTMIIHNNQVIVGGSFTQADGIPANNIAVYDLMNSQWQSMGNIDSTVNTLAVFNNEIYAGGAFQPMLLKWNGTNWQDANQIGFYGNEVRTLEVVNNELIIGGDFELPTGALRKNVVGFDGTQFIYMGFGTLTPVNDLAFYNGRIYAACDVISGNDTCALALFNATNNDWEKVIIPLNGLGNSFSGEKICALAVNGNEMICGGNFWVGAGLYFGQNIMRFQQNSIAPANDYSIAPILYLDSTVNTIAMNSSIAYFGGEFINNNVSNILNHVAYFDVLTGIKENPNKLSKELEIYPNPANDFITLSFNSDFNSGYTIFINDILGKEVLQIPVPNNSTQYNISISSLSSGIYHINVMGNNHQYHKKIVIKHVN
jgi:hypothetical protein